MKIFLRFTEDPGTDMLRGTSVHATSASSIEEAREWHGEEGEYMQIGGQVCMILNGLCGYYLDAETIEEAVVEYYSDYEGSRVANSFVDENRRPVFFEGEFSEDELPDGFLFHPIRILNAL